MQINHHYFKSAVGFFSFFSSTNVETKTVCPIAYNVIRLAEVAKKQSLIFDFAKTLQTQKQF